MKFRGFVIVTAVLTLATAGAAGAGGLRFTQKVGFEFDETLEIGKSVGPVLVDSVEFSRGGTGGGFGKSVLGKFKGEDNDAHAHILVAFECENPTREEWEIKFTVEFLDAEGEVIDRARMKKELDNEARVLSINHETLSYVIPLIKKVVIRVEGRED